MRSIALAHLFAQDPQRAQRCVASVEGVRLDYSRQRVDGQVVQQLLLLAEERGLAEWRAALFAGEPINTTEQRAVGHTALRAAEAAPAPVRTTLAQMHRLAQRLRGEGRVRRIVHLGTGGSALGPQLVVDALGTHDTDLEIAFAANIDALDLERALTGAQPETTLFVVVSKTFTTAETLANARTALRWLGGRDSARHFIAVTGNEAAARAFGIDEVLPLPEAVGGRFSLWSAAGLSALCAIGAARFDALAGNAYMDGLERRLQRKIVAVATYIVATERLGAARAATLIRDNLAVSDANFVLDYFRLSADHRLLFGGRVSYSGVDPLGTLFPADKSWPTWEEAT